MTSRTTAGTTSPTGNGAGGAAPVATVSGLPRQGANRELKKAVEAYWAGRLDADALLSTARELRLTRLRMLADAGIGQVPVNDFSFYDHVLDTAVLLGAVPARHVAAVPDAGDAEGRLDRLFAMARGTAEAAPLEMTKWFDTNYHQLVPELAPDTAFTLDPTKPLEELAEAGELGLDARPVVVGPVTFLLRSKAAPDAPAGFEPLSLLDRVLPLYTELLGRLAAAGAREVQLDEPALVQDQPAAVLDAVTHAYEVLTGPAAPADRPAILVATYFDSLGDALPVLAATDVEGLAVDLTGPAAGDVALLADVEGLAGKRLVAGVVDGRNIWRTDLSAALRTCEDLVGLAGRVDVGASCSLLHVPLDTAMETAMDPQLRGWLAFAQQKLEELAVLARGLGSGRDAVADELRANRELLAARADSPLVRDPDVQRRTAAVVPGDLERTSGYDVRRKSQADRLGLPPLPTTTIGSFPQTPALRKDRADLRAGRIDAAAYDAAMRAEVERVVTQQTELGLDVFVHGEPERNDMVQYFAEQLDGYAATEHGWVQSYGSRCVRPPILFGDVSRPTPMTVEWATYAQSLTEKPVKGMLTGPVTMLAWSFVRDDQPAGETARQVALALRDEVADLEAAGIRVVQVDEPALRETLPLRTAARAAYLRWAVDAFRLSTAGVQDATQIHTHMCYAEFGDVLQAITDMDADVISLEAARSEMAIVADLARAGYPNEVGPGVWDIHSPRVPSADEVETRLRSAIDALPVERVWVNPDCGLKTRRPEEVAASLTNLVEATRRVRAGL